MTSPRAVEGPRRAMRALDDAALIGQMRAGVPEAWQEFMQRFQPLLEKFARRTGMPRADWTTCVADVLEDAALRWAANDEPPPRSVAAYLVRAVSFHRMTLERDTRRRRARDERAARDAGAEGVVLSLCSAAALRDSAGLAALADDRAAGARQRFVQRLTASLTDAERGLLERVGDGLPHREIGAWLGVSAEAARKRVQRLAARVRELVPQVLASLEPHDRAEAERLLRRCAHPSTPRRGDDDDV